MVDFDACYSYNFTWQIAKKLEPLPSVANEEINLSPCGREKTNCTIFLGFTSNMISSGVRDCIRYLVQHNMVGLTHW